VEVGLAPNIMKGFTADIFKDFSHNYDRIIQMLWKKGNKIKYLYFESVWNDATWHSEISDCGLSPQAYLDYKTPREDQYARNQSKGGLNFVHSKANL
jgi:hypothetical protein